MRSKKVKGHFKVNFRNNKAQCNLTTLFGKLEDRFVCCGSFVIKRKQGLSMDKAEQASGIVVDLPPNKLEGYGLELLLKKVASYTKKQFHLAADGDMKVTDVTSTIHFPHKHTFVTNIFCLQHPSPIFFVSNIRHKYFLSPTSVINIFVTNFSHYHILGTFL